MRQTHMTKLRVRIDETDMAGVVHFSKYFVYFDITHWNPLKSLGISYSSLESTNVKPRIIVANCEYKSPAQYDDTLIIRAEVSEVRERSVKYVYETRKEQDDTLDTLITTGYVIHAFIDGCKSQIGLEKSCWGVFDWMN